jgi:hypothetical protein
LKLGNYSGQYIASNFMVEGKAEQATSLEAGGKPCFHTAFLLSILS